MKKIIWISASILIVMLFACKDTYNKVTADYDKSFDFTKYKTFAWLPDKVDTTNTPYNNEIIRNNIRNYFGQCMSDRGYSFNAENPDVLMRLVIKNIKKEREISTYKGSYDSRPYYYGSHYYSPYPFGYYYNNYTTYGDDYAGYPNTQKQEYVNGSITLIFIDRKEKKIVWSGTAEGDIYDPSHVSKDLHPAVHSILDEYPVKSLVKRSHEIN